LFSFFCIFSYLLLSHMALWFGCLWSYLFFKWCVLLCVMSHDGICSLTYPICGC
jgi:hypothetical protein